MNDLLQYAPQALQIATSVIGTASVIAAITPTPKDDAILAVLRKAIDFLGFNFGYAKNK